MITINDCVQDITFDINGQCVLPQQFQTNNALSNELLYEMIKENNELLYEMIKENKQCCELTFKYLYTILDILNEKYYHTYECKPCQVINIPIEHKPILYPLETPTTFLPSSLPEPIKIDYSLYIDNTQHYKFIKYSPDPRIKGGFSIIGIPGTWSVISGRILNESGDDLIKYLPLIYNYKIDSLKIVLERINCYKIIHNKPLLTYQILDLKTGERKVFDAGTNIWDKWAKK